MAGVPAGIRTKRLPNTSLQLYRMTTRSAEACWQAKLKSSLCLTHYRRSLSLSESYVTTDGQSASVSWNKAPIWGLRPDFYYCQRVAGLLMWGALSDEKTGLSFTTAAGPRQHSPLRLATTFYCLRFETSLFFTSYDSQGYGGGIRSRLRKGGLVIRSCKHGMSSN
jgi:hypothetical protein